MDHEVTEQILDEIVPRFQNLEAQSAAILQFLKDKGIASDNELVPYLEQAATASVVRWRAARLRIARLLASIEKSGEEAAKEQEKAASEQTRKTEEQQTSAGEKKNAEAGAEEDAKKTDKDQQASGNREADDHHADTKPVKPDNASAELKAADQNRERSNAERRPIKADSKPAGMKKSRENAGGESIAKASGETDRKRA
jgi:hypothetical protein